ncbi:hypothetical protein M0R45_017208 [Rubus argutus]|uniref:Uncharacterized protein n=1 Tax=Rubus argutus TaxID=59490 RepID=A0AAW1XV17_RUBAR
MDSPRPKGGKIRPAKKDTARKKKKAQQSSSPPHLPARAVSIQAASTSLPASLDLSLTLCRRKKRAAAINKERRQRRKKSGQRRMRKEDRARE